MMMDLDNFFHVGVIVDDFDAKVSALGREFGLAWSPIIDVDITMWTRDHGRRSFRARAIFSVQHPHIELVEAVPDTPLTVKAGRPIHHFGYWTDNLERDSDALARAGWPKIMCAEHEGRMFGIAYHQRPDGMIVELVDRSCYADWNGFLAGKIEHTVIVPAAPERPSAG